MPFPNIHAARSKKPNDNPIVDDEKHVKTFPFVVTETKELNTDKGHYGIIKGYASTYGNIDRGGDVVIAGAFSKSLERYKACGRPIRMQLQHSKMAIIGGFSPDKAIEDEKGLFVEGEINLDVQNGRETYALAKQGVLTDMSICYTINDYSYGSEGEKLLKSLELWEISIVGEPMNPEATIMSVKSVSSFKDLPLANRDAVWDKQTAIKRIKKFTQSDSKPSEGYKNAFMWHDKENEDNFDSYKLPYVDVIDGELKAVPKALFIAAAVIKSARSKLKMSAEDKTKVIADINKYYEKMGLDIPLREFYDSTIVCKDVNWISSKDEIDSLLDDFDVSIDVNNSRDTEENLREVCFSKQAAGLLISVYKRELGEPVRKLEDKNEVLDNYLKQVIEQVTKLKPYLIK